MIPLFAIGAFLAFTLSQAGMVMHWRRVGGPHARHSMIVNAVGATATGITLVVILCAKFLDGAWITPDGRTLMLCGAQLNMPDRASRKGSQLLVELAWMFQAFNQIPSRN